MCSFASLALWSGNTACLLDRYSHSLWKKVAQVLPQVPEEALAILSQAASDGRDVAKFAICCGLNMTDSLGRAISSIVAVQPHTWLRTSGFSGDVQTSLIDPISSESR